MPATLIKGIVTTGANSIELGALNTKSPVGRGLAISVRTTRFCSGVSIRNAVHIELPLMVTICQTSSRISLSSETRSVSFGLSARLLS